MSHQAYNIVNTHVHEISGWTIISKLIHARAPHLGGMNVDVRTDLVTLESKNGEQLETFLRKIIWLQQAIIIYGEPVYPTIILFQYIQTLQA